MKLTTSTVINGTTYSTTQYAPSRALKILTLLGKVAGGPLGQLASLGGVGGMMNLQMNSGTAEIISKAVMAIFENLDENKIDYYVKEILSETTIGGGSMRVVDQFETQFQGKLDELFMLLKWVLQENFGNFLKGLIAKRSLVAQNPA